MKEQEKGAYCLNCRSVDKSRNGKSQPWPRGFIPDWKTAIMANQKFMLDLIEKNSEGLIKLEQMKEAGLLNNISKLEMPVEENKELRYPEDKIIIPTPVYKPEVPPMTEDLGLPGFQAYLDHAMTTEQLNALLRLACPSYLEFLKKQENSIHGASNWSKQYFPSNFKPRTHELSDAEAQSYAEARQKEIQELSMQTRPSQSHSASNPFVAYAQSGWRNSRPQEANTNTHTTNFLSMILRPSSNDESGRSHRPSGMI
jgi:hypothetical protein